MRAEVVGPRVPTPEQVRGFEKQVSREIGEPVQLALRAQVDVMVTGKRYRALGKPGA